MNLKLKEYTTKKKKLASDTVATPSCKEKQVHLC